MEPTKHNIFVTFTILGLALAVMMGYSYLGDFLYSLTDEWLFNQEAGVFRQLSWLFHSPWTDVLIRYAIVLGVGYLLAAILSSGLPKDQRRPEKLSGADFFLCLLASMGLGYFFNFIGTGINWAIAEFTGKSYLDMNPVTEMMYDMSPSMILYSCILGPLSEEVIFRGVLLKRARLYGDLTAVIFTALTFGLMHGNLVQFLYASVIGLIFGYVAVKTNGIRYTVILHIIVNSYSMIIALAEERIYQMDPYFLTSFFTAAVVVLMIFMVIGGFITVIKCGPIWYRKLAANNGEPSPNKKYVYRNPGFYTYLGLCLLEFLAYLI